MPVNSFDNYPMSWKPEKDKLPRPIYRSLAELMEHDIAEGLLLPGTKLPSQRELADFLDINFTTVTRAYKLCEYKGLIQSVTGSGTFVSMHSSKSEPLSMTFSGENVIDMGPDTGFEETHAMILPLMKKILELNYTEQFLNYKQQTGMAHQRKAASQWMNRLGLKVDYNDLVIMTGSLNSTTDALLTFFKSGDRIAVDTYTYANFIELSKLLHMTLVPVPGDDQGMSASALDATCRKTNLAGIFLMPSCANPSAVYISEERKKELASVIKKYDLMLIEDDCAGFMTYGYVADCGAPMHTLLPDNSVYICSMSKSFCSGIRIAFVAVPPAAYSSFERTIYNTNVKTSSLDAEIAAQGILDGTAELIVEKRIELAKERNVLFDSILGNITGDIPGRHPYPFFRWLRLPDGADPQGTAARLLTQGVHVYSSERFCADPKAKEGFLRISLSAADSEEALKKGLEVIRDEIIKN